MLALIEEGVNPGSREREAQNSQRAILGLGQSTSRTKSLIRVAEMVKQIVITVIIKDSSLPQ